MKLLALTGDAAMPVTELAFAKATAIELGHGSGEAHVHSLNFEPGGSIPRHPAGFGQLLVVVGGSGWVAGEDDVRVYIRAGQAVFFHRHELHSKGSEEGMTALVIQVRDLEVGLPSAGERGKE